MSPHIGIQFRVEIPTVPAVALTTFHLWLKKYGLATVAKLSEDNNTHVVTIVCKDFFRQNGLLRSLRLKFAKHGLAQLCNQVHVFSIPHPKPTTTLATQTREQLEARVTQLETQFKELNPVINNINNTNITNNIFIQNFGFEDVSYLQNPIEYLEKTFAGMRTLLQDIYFNDDQKQNHTVRLNMAAHTVEVHRNGEWRPLDVPIAANAMIGNCKTYIIQGFNSDVHKENDNVMDFVCSLAKPTTTEPLQADIAAGLVKRSSTE